MWTASAVWKAINEHQRTSNKSRSFCAWQETWVCPPCLACSLAVCSSNKCLNIHLCVHPAQETTGKQGMLGPTKLYLAVQPSQPTHAVMSSPATQTSPPPLTPSRAPQHNQISQVLFYYY